MCAHNIIIMWVSLFVCVCEYECVCAHMSVWVCAHNSVLVCVCVCACVYTHPCVCLRKSFLKEKAAQCW